MTKPLQSLYSTAFNLRNEISLSMYRCDLWDCAALLQLRR